MVYKSISACNATHVIFIITILLLTSVGCVKAKPVGINRIAEIFMREFATCQRLVEAMSDIDPIVECAEDRAARAIKAISGNAESIACLARVVPIWRGLAVSVQTRQRAPAEADIQFVEEIARLGEEC